VELDFSERDRRLLAAGEEIVRDIFARLDSGEVRKRASLHWSHHHMGGTRMSEAAADGVVDPQLRVHGTENLYVLSSSVYVTSGTANPTLTIVALAHRLADHLIHQT
jgi:choline dehydrogenase-like flavoprotein